MKGISALDQRRMRIDLIKTQIENSFGEFNFIVYKKFVWEIQQRYGFTETKAMEYIELAMNLLNAKVSENGEIVKKISGENGQ